MESRENLILERDLLELYNKLQKDPFTNKFRNSIEEEYKNVVRLGLIKEFSFPVYYTRKDKGLKSFSPEFIQGYLNQEKDKRILYLSKEFGINPNEISQRTNNYFETNIETLREGSPVGTMSDFFKMWDHHNSREARYQFLKFNTPGELIFNLKIKDSFEIYSRFFYKLESKDKVILNTNKFISTVIKKGIRDPFFKDFMGFAYSISQSNIQEKLSKQEELIYEIISQSNELIANYNNHDNVEK